MIARSLEFRASENLRSTSTTQPSAPRMQSNSERMAGCVVAVNHNHLKQMIARSLEFGVHLRGAVPINSGAQAHRIYCIYCIYTVYILYCIYTVYTVYCISINQQFMSHSGYGQCIESATCHETLLYCKEISRRQSTVCRHKATCNIKLPRKIRDTCRHKAFRATSQERKYASGVGDMVLYVSQQKIKDCA